MPRKRSSSPLRGLLPVAAGSLLGLLAGGGLLLHAQQQAATVQRQQLVEAWASGPLGALQQGLQQLAADTRALAGQAELRAALAGDAAARAQAVERLHGYRRDLLDVQLNLRGGAQLDEARAVPLNFAALDLLRRAEQGPPPPVEAYRVGTRWLLYSAAAITDASGQVQGSLLLVSDLQRLLDRLPPQSAALGELQLIQQFPDSPPQVLLQRGQGDGELRTWPSAHPYWQLGLRPGPALQPAAPPAWSLLLAGLLALGGALGGAAVQPRRRADEPAAPPAPAPAGVPDAAPAQAFEADYRELADLLAELPGDEPRAPAAV
ncbi:MAG TPA: phosphomannomutase/phosphoglucomutase, partial [Pseudomonas sp.]|nr:phosphomannomutase/phosphoglucomutase [Pseudomonas sp.]